MRGAVLRLHEGIESLDGLLGSGEPLMYGSDASALPLVQLCLGYERQVPISNSRRTSFSDIRSWDSSRQPTISGVGRP